MKSYKTGKTAIILFALIIIIITGGVWYFAKSSDDSTGAFTVGYIGPLTGPSAVLGMDAATALRIASDEYASSTNAKKMPVRLVVEDDQYLSEKTISAYNKLVTIDHAKVILVATYGGVLAIGDRAKRDRVVVLDPLDCNAEIAHAEKNVFCLATDTQSIGYTLAEAAKAREAKRVIIMYSTKDSFMSIVAHAFRERYGQSGAINEESFAYDTTDFRSQLLRMKGMSPDALVLLGHDETGLIMKQARELGISAQFYTTGTVTSPSLQKAAQGAAEGTIFAYWDASALNTKAAAFEHVFEAQAGRAPFLALTTHPAYDAFAILVNTVAPKLVGKLATDDAIRAQLLSVKNYQGTTGIITMNADGGARIPETTYRLVDGKPVPVQD